MRKLDFQPLVDKATTGVSGWHGRHLTQAGRNCLVLLTVPKASHEVLAELDKTRKKFLWTGDSLLTGGKCKVSRTRCSLPKENGGLGILNLNRFARALRLRWLWHEWVSPDKPWIGTKTSCDNTDHLLFVGCTTVSIGNGKEMSFWHSGWLQGPRPKDIAPHLFKITDQKIEQ